MKPYRWAHPISIVPSNDYVDDYPANTAYVKAQGIKTRTGKPPVLSSFSPDARYWVIVSQGNTNYVVWGGTGIFITRLTLLLGITKAYP